MRLSDLVRDQSPDSPEGAPLRDLPVATRVSAAPGFVRDGRPSSIEAGACVDWYVTAQKEVATVAAGVRSNRGLAFDRCQVLAKELVTALKTGDDLLQRVMQGDVEDYQTANAVHVAILSVKVGMGLHYDEAGLERLALAGLLHDLGMWAIAQDIVAKPAALTESERLEIQAHPEQGRRMAAGMGEPFHWLATAIAQEQERWDGSGYPCRLKGGAITEIAQILGLADMFDAMISPRPYRTRVVPHQALRALLVEHKQAFQPRLIKTLVDQLSLYPIGTSVRLNDGHVGIVSKVNARYPLRPVLLVHRNREGQSKGDAASVDLSRETAMHIVEVLPGTRAA